MTDDKFELTRRKALLGLGTIGAAGAGAGVGTSALFSDEESFTNNSIEAGELDLVVDYETSYSFNDEGTGSGEINGNPADYSYVLSDVKPGDSGELRFCPKIVDNPGWLWIGSVDGLTGYENGQTEPEEDVDSTGGDPGEGNGELAEAVQVDVSYCTTGGEPIRELNNPDDYTLADLFKELESGLLLDGDLETDGTQAYPSSPDADTQNGPCLCIDWNVPLDVGNEIQSDSVEFEFTFAAYQERNNPEPDNPFADETVAPGGSIQSAIDSAPDGGIVSVHGMGGATYAENLDIDKPLTLARASLEQPVVDGDNSALRTITVTADDVTIDGFEITGAESSQQNFGVMVLPKDSGTRSNFRLCNSRVTDLEAEGRATGLSINMDPSNISANPAPAENIDVYNCTFENIRCSTTNPGTGGGVQDNRSKAKGIALVGGKKIDGTRIRHVTVQDIGNSATTFGRGVSIVEGSDSSVGPVDFTIRYSEFSGMEGAFNNPYSGAAMFVGEYADFGDHVVEDNNIESPVENFPNGEPPQSSNDVLNAPNNYWDASDGPSGPGGSGSGVAVTKNVDFEPIRSSALSGNDVGSTV